MNDLMKKGMSFATFDTPVQAVHISTQFKNVHTKLQEGTTGWSTNATQQILISLYWYRYVMRHFLLLFGMPAFVHFFMHGINHPGYYFLSVVATGLLTFVVLYAFHYRPSFLSTFLPRLVTVKEVYDNQQTGLVEKCRKAQLSNFALTLVFYAIDKTTNLNSLRCDDSSAKLLAKLYGVDTGSLKKNLALIFSKGKNFSVRKSTEMQNQFEEAVNFLEDINFTKAVQSLESLKQKLLANG